MIGIVITGVVLFLVCAIIGIIGIIMGYRIWQAQSLAFVSNQFDEAGRKGARTEIRRLGNLLDILTYLNDDPVKTQAMLQMVYAFNRIGAGIRTGALSQRVIFQTWKKSWFINNWLLLEPLIQQERKRRKDPNLYDSFEWLHQKI